MKPKYTILEILNSGINVRKQNASNVPQFGDLANYVLESLTTELVPRLQRIV